MPFGIGRAILGEGRIGGDGLDAEKSKELARLLREDLKSGMAENYVQTRNKALSELPFEICELCEGTGIRKEEVGKNAGFPDKELDPDVQVIVGRQKGYCNACNSMGKREHFATNYFLDVEDIEQFAEFLEDCGGFEIW